MAFLRDFAVAVALVDEVVEHGAVENSRRVARKLLVVSVNGVRLEVKPRNTFGAASDVIRIDHNDVIGYR